MKNTYLFLITLFMSSCSHELMNKSSKSEKQKIIFSTYYYEYAFKEYGPDSLKLSHPLRYIKDQYPIAYTLTAKELIIYKSFNDTVASDTLFKVILNKEQTAIFDNEIKRVVLDSIASQTTNPGINDGFQVSVTISKNRKNTSFFWNNTYYPTLVNLLSLTNSLSPNTYKFYPADKEVDFIKFLQQMSTTY